MCVCAIIMQCVRGEKKLLKAVNSNLCGFSGAKMAFGQVECEHTFSSSQLKCSVRGVIVKKKACI